MRASQVGWRALVILAALAPAFPARAVAPTPEELAEARRWAAARFEGAAPALPPGPGLVVRANHDAVERDGRGGKPLNLAGKKFPRGLYCHAPSEVLVRLPSPGREFTALVGVDSNEQTANGRGSVVFRATLGDQEAFRSPLLREGAAPLPVRVPLNGATEFVLHVTDGGDGIACDQSDWADARVTLADGKEVPLGSLPLTETDALKGLTDEPPFSFRFDGQPSAALLKSWGLKRSRRPLDDRRTEHTLTASDPKTGLAVRMVAIEYRDFPTLEWTVYLKNTAAAPTPLVEDLQALDVAFVRGAKGEFLLHHAAGSPADGNDYAPRETPLGPGAKKRLAGAGGRPTNQDWAYFNLEWPGASRIVAVGWPGQWAADLTRDPGRTVRLRAGQELTKFKLLPGEEVRTPLIAVQFSSGDWLRSQNLWRRWMQAHALPRPGGQLPQPMLLASSSRQLDEMVKATESNQIAFIDRYLAEGIPLNYWWMDAGWYVNDGGWPNVGTWEVDPKRFPRGLKPVTDHAHARGLKTLLWFEPERVTANSWLAKTHPEWVLGGSQGGLLNLGDPAARDWLTAHVDRLLREQGIDLYRQDFNMDPLPHWRAHDSPDRQGITEIRHATGYLAYWDELLRRRPNMLIDSCASGGRRNDLETMRRAVPLWRSDYAYEAVGHQAMTHGISLWLPYHGTGTVATRNAPYYGSGPTPVEPYAFWSNTAPSLGLGIDVRLKELDYPALKRLIAGWRRLSANYYGDFYPLTPWSRDPAVWTAWQFDRPEVGEGAVQVFRRDVSPYESARLPLRGLDPAATYEVTNLDDEAHPRTQSGRELLERGMPVTITDRPAAAVFFYRKAGGGKGIPTGTR